jgi:hypothetical protein
MQFYFRDIVKGIVVHQRNQRLITRNNPPFLRKYLLAIENLMYSSMHSGQLPAADISASLLSQILQNAARKRLEFAQM